MERFTLTDVIIVFGDTYSLLRFIYNIFCNIPLGNVWITTSDWDITTLPFGQSLSYTDFGGGLSFSVPMDEILGFKDFLRGVQPGKYPHNTFIQDVWSKLFECPYLDQNFVRNLSRCEQNGTFGYKSSACLGCEDLTPELQSPCCCVRHCPGTARGAVTQSGRRLT